MSDEPPTKPTSEEPSKGNEDVNIVIDVVTGPNMRWRDNLYQGLAILVCMLLGAAIGYFTALRDHGFAAVLGGFLGVVIGLFGSGAVLMVYRGLRHLGGKHD